METEKVFDAVKEKLAANENLEELQKVADSDVDEAAQALENDPDVIKLKEQQAELMRLIADPNVMKAYRASRHVGERRKVTQKEKKKKKAKRRMAKKSKR